MNRNRRDFLKTSGAGIAMSILPAVLANEGDDTPQKNRPNILYLHTHDLGRYCQPYGYAIPTPNMQKLAEAGVLFYNCFSAAPTCSPSRAALLTGQYPHNCGMLGLAHRGDFRLYDYKHHIIHTLRKAGYYSALIGVQHIIDQRSVKEIGYDEIVPVSHSAENIAGSAAKWLQNPPKQPFFASVGFSVTHREFAKPGPQDDARYCRPPEPIPNTPETRYDMACYKASARILDKCYGVVLDALRKNGLDDNTLVICTTDHGIAFPSMKCNLTDHGTGVALIMRGPGGFTGGKTCDAMISQMDVFPTVCDILGIDKPDWLQGKSFIPVIRGDAAEINDEVFAEVNYHAAYEPMRAVRTKRWKYIKRFDNHTTPVLPNCDDGPSKDLWLKSGWKDKTIAQEQLYDLVFDPIEVNNLTYSIDPQTRKVLDDMRSRLDRWMKATNDPLLKGPIVPPPGAIWRANDPNGLSPQEPPLEIKQ